MPSQISHRDYAQAVLESVRSGAIPQSEEVISAELPPAAIPTVLKLIDEAREDVKRLIRSISKDSAPDVDGWISQAKQLRRDIEDVERSAEEIVKQAEHGEKLQRYASDAASKVALLNREAVFNEALVATLENIRNLRQTLGLIDIATENDNFLDAVGLLEKAENGLRNLRAGENPKIAGLFQARITDLRYTLLEGLTDCWKTLLHVDPIQSTISICDQIQRSTIIQGHLVIQASSRLGLLEESISTFCKDINTVILMPRLQAQEGGAFHSVNVEDNSIRISGELADLSIEKLFADMNSVVGFLHTRLPPSISSPLAALLMPSLIQRLISNWLIFQVPIDVEGIKSFKSVLNSVVQFAITLDSFGWPGKEILVKWTNEIPEVWLNKRREISLDKVRRLLFGGLGSIERVDRFETQMLSPEDDAPAWSESREAELNAEPSDEVARGPEASPQPSGAKNCQSVGEEEDDVTAWGLDEEPDENSTKRNSEHPDDGNEGGDEDTDAWGWGDDNDDGEPSKPAVPSSPAQKKITNALSKGARRDSREVTLKETYNITALPKQILEIITHIVYDAEMLRAPDYVESPIASAAGSLFSLPGLVLSMYRASAQNHYSMNTSGRMFLYNDSLWLAESLRQFTGTQSKRSGQINVGAAETEISALELFAKRTYAQEMESQRTIISDLLDGVQAFVHCTEPPFSQECDIAVSSTVDRLRDVYKQWKAVLSHSALLQSIGSLLSTVVNKIIVDVEDMSDISEPESQRLTDFCNRIAALEDLFTPEVLGLTAAGGEPPIPLTAVYTPNWLKFQYLSNILESSLVDIIYLWTEGELRLEFETEELVDLIEALFADSEHRRKAIGEIRRGSVRK